MKPGSRKIAKWRKKSPATHRSYAEKRDRLNRHVVNEIRDSVKDKVIERLNRLYEGE